MKLLSFTLYCSLCVSRIAFAEFPIEGYYNEDGTFVAPHYTYPYTNTDENWSTLDNAHKSIKRSQEVIVK